MTGKPVYPLLGHTAPVSGVVFNKLTDQFISAAYDGTIRFWRQHPGRSLLQYPLQLDGRGLNDALISADTRYLMQPSTIETQPAVFDKSGKAVGSTLPTYGNLASNFDENRAFLWQSDKITYIDPSASRNIRSRSFPEASIKDCIALDKSRCCIVVFDHQLPLYWHAEKDELLPLISNDDELKSAFVSHDGSQFILGTANGYCQVHEASTGKLVRRVHQASSVLSACATPDMTRILTVDNASRLRVWADDDLLPQSIIQESGYLFNNCVITADSKVVITFNDEKASEVRCWDLATGKLLHKTDGAAAQAVMAHPTKPIAFLGSKEKGLQQWAIDTNILRSISSDSVVNMRLAGNDLVTREFPKNSILPPSEVIKSPVLSLATIRSYTIDSGEKNGEFKIPSATISSNVSISNDGQKVGLAYRNFSATIIDREIPRWRTRVGGHAEPISFAAFLSKTNEVITASWDGSARIWNDQYQLNHMLQSESGAAVTCGALSRNEDFVAIGYKDGAIILWDIRKAEKLATLKADASRIQSIAMDKSAQHLISTDDQGVVRYWTVPSRENIVCSKEGEPSTAILSPDEQRVLLLGWQESNGQITARPAQFFDLKSRKHIDLPETFEAVAGNFSPDGKQLGLALADGSAVIFKLNASGRFEASQTIIVPEVSIENIAFADEDLVALKSQQEVLLYETEAQQLRSRCLSWTGSRILSAAQHRQWQPFSPDKKWLAFSTWKVLSLMPLDATKAVAAVTTRQLTDQEKGKYQVGLEDLAKAPTD